LRSATGNGIGRACHDDLHRVLDVAHSRGSSVASIRQFSANVPAVHRTLTYCSRPIENLHTSASRKGRHVQRETFRPSGARVRGSVAGIASAEEMNLMKPIDKSILGMGSKSPGRNESEPTGGLVKK